MPATINGTTGFGGNLTGNVTGNVTGTASAIADGAVSAAKLNGGQAGSAPIFGVRAWVHFNGTTSPPTINASGNVTSVTKNSTGDYTINFTTALPNANYAASLARTGGSNGIGCPEVSRSTTQYRFTLVNLAVNASVDEASVSATFVG